MNPVRPTRRCLEDLGLQFPSLKTDLSLLDHELVRAAQRLPELLEAHSVQRVVSLQDRVFYKVKKGRHRAAATRLGADESDVCEPSLPEWWLCAAGWREEGSASDFYQDLTAECRRAASGDMSAPHGATRTGHLLPDEIDRKRWVAECAVRWEADTELVVQRVIAHSMRTGKPVTAQQGDWAFTALVRAPEGNEAYLVITTPQVHDLARFAVVLDMVPGVTAGDWQPEPGPVGGLRPPAGHVVWSTILPPATAAALLALPELDETHGLTEHLPD